MRFLVYKFNLFSKKEIYINYFFICFLVLFIFITLIFAIDSVYKYLFIFLLLFILIMSIYYSVLMKKNVLLYNQKDNSFIYYNDKCYVKDIDRIELLERDNLNSEIIICLKDGNYFKRTITYYSFFKKYQKMEIKNIYRLINEIIKMN